MNSKYGKPNQIAANASGAMTSAERIRVNMGSKKPGC
jgi:hypothetical protein